MGTLWITGANGFVGSRLTQEIDKRNQYTTIYAFTHKTLIPSSSSSRIVPKLLDISNYRAVCEAACVAPPNVVINLAAMANADTCETSRVDAWYINSLGPMYLARICRQYQAFFIHLSTEHVFPGNETQPGPYGESSPPHPVNFYGWTKLEGEKAIAEICGNNTPYTVVRVSPIYDTAPGKRSNFVTWLIRVLLAGRRVQVVSDQWSTPILLDDFVQALIWLIEHRRTGIYHIAGPDRIAYHQWAFLIAQRLKLDCNLIDSVKTADLCWIAARPCLGGLLCERLIKDLSHGIQSPRGIGEGLDALIAETC